MCIFVEIKNIIMKSRQSTVAKELNKNFGINYIGMKLQLDRKLKEGERFLYVVCAQTGNVYSYINEEGDDEAHPFYMKDRDDINELVQIEIN